MSLFQIEVEAENAWHITKSLVMEIILCIWCINVKWTFRVQHQGKQKRNEVL